MKKHSSIALIGKMLSLVKPYIYLIVLAVLVGSLGFFAAMGITFFAGLAIFSYLGEPLAISFAWLLALIVIFGFSRGLLRYVEQYLNHFMAFTLLAHIRDQLFGSLRKQGSKVLDDRSKGEVLSILQSDVETMEVFYAHTITPFLIAIIVEAGVAIALGLLCGYQFALLSIACDLIIGILAPIIFYRNNKKLGRLYREELSRSETIYLNSIYGIDETIFAGRQKDDKKAIDETSNRLNSLSKKLNQKASRNSEIVNILIAISDIAIIAIGALLYAHGDISSPAIIIGYATLAASFGPVVALANLPANLTMSFASANRVLDIIEEEPKTVDGDNEFDFKSLEVHGVSFSYDKEHPVVKNVNFSLSKGQFIGIHGKSGSGKSTILKLLLHFEDPDTGVVLYNDEPVSTYSRQSIAKNVTLFSQSTYLFQGSIGYNLKIAKPDASEEELIEACKKAGISAYSQSTEKGLDTAINALQDNLSTGEKQRLGLARVFLAKTPLLLLDEATSNVDASNEAHILNQLSKCKNDLALIVISHRESTLSICDKVYKLENGLFMDGESKKKPSKSKRKKA